MRSKRIASPTRPRSPTRDIWEVDPSTVAFLSSFRREGSRCRKMAEDTLLPKDRHSARSGEQSENQKHHECALLACNSFGSGRTAIRSRAFARVQSDRKHQTSG